MYITHSLLWTVCCKLVPGCSHFGNSKTIQFVSLCRRYYN
nr:MAG TPA: Polyubiquitin-C [Caudoviricetes sp.]